MFFWCYFGSFLEGLKMGEIREIFGRLLVLKPLSLYFRLSGMKKIAYSTEYHYRDI